MSEDRAQDSSQKFVEYNERSIRSGIPLSHLKEVVDAYRDGQNTLDFLIGRANIAFRLHTDDSDVKEAIAEIISAERDDGDDSFAYEDYRPNMWNENDPDLQKKIDKFVGLLSQAIEKESER